MSNLSISKIDKYNYFDGVYDRDIRIIMIGPDPWFVAKDLCDTLGYENGRKAIADHVDDDDKNTVTNRDGIRGNPNITVVNESGLYSLIFASKLPTAKKFKHWVTSTVLPMIRKTGAFMSPHAMVEAALTPEFLIRLVNALQSEQAKVEAARKEADEAKRKANNVATDIARKFNAMLKNEGYVDALPKPKQEDSPKKIDAPVATKVHNTMPRKVLCVETGIVYQSIADSAKAMKVTRAAIIYALHDIARTCRGFHWRAAEKED